MKITKNQLKRIIKEERARFLSEQKVEVEEEWGSEAHHWPRVDWNNVESLVDKWHDMEIKSFDEGDPSMNPTDSPDDSVSDNKEFWREQVDSASMDLEAELTVRVRKLALQTMKEFTEKLINGDYS